MVFSYSNQQVAKITILIMRKKKYLTGVKKNISLLLIELIIFNHDQNVGR